MKTVNLILSVTEKDGSLQYVETTGTYLVKQQPARAYDWSKPYKTQPTHYMIFFGRRWRRIYSYMIGNAGGFFFKCHQADYFITNMHNIFLLSPRYPYDLPNTHHHD